MRIILELDPAQAAGLKRFAEKVSHDNAMAVLYPHVRKEVRDDQAYAIVDAFSALDRALADAGARSWPWVETGEP